MASYFGSYLLLHYHNFLKTPLDSIFLSIPFLLLKGCIPALFKVSGQRSSCLPKSKLLGFCRTWGEESATAGSKLCGWAPSRSNLAQSSRWDCITSALWHELHLSAHSFTYCISLLDTVWVTLGGLEMPVEQGKYLKNDDFFFLKQ